MADLDIDLDDLESLVSTLGVVRTEFDSAEQFATTVADLVGHDGLAGVVRDFATQWNLRRSELLEELDYLAAATTSIRLWKTSASTLTSAVTSLSVFFWPLNSMPCSAV